MILLFSICVYIYTYFLKIKIVFFSSSFFFAHRTVFLLSESLLRVSKCRGRWDTRPHLAFFILRKVLVVKCKTVHINTFHLICYCFCNFSAYFFKILLHISLRKIVASKCLYMQNKLLLESLGGGRRATEM